MAAAITKRLGEDSRIKLVANPADAVAVLACQRQMERLTTSGHRTHEAEVATHEAEVARRAWAKLRADGNSGRPLRWIAYDVESLCSDAKADMTYTTDEGGTEQDTANTPWIDVEPYPSREGYYLSAQKHDGTVCEITARIYSIRLTLRQFRDLTGGDLKPVSVEAYVEAHGSELREATSTAAYGIAEVQWAGEGNR